MGTEDLLQNEWKGIKPPRLVFLLSHPLKAIKSEKTGKVHMDIDVDVLGLKKEMGEKFVEIRLHLKCHKTI